MNVKYLVLFVLLAFLLSCTSVKKLDDLVGVYKVSSKACKGNVYEKSSCEEIELLEIVKGNFYKVEDHEYAFVIWSGNTELNYNARKLNNFSEPIDFPYELIVDKNDIFVEKLYFSSSKIGKYEFGSQESLSTLSIEKADPEEIKKYSKEYPGNN